MGHLSVLKNANLLAPFVLLELALHVKLDLIITMEGVIQIFLVTLIVIFAQLALKKHQTDLVFLAQLTVRLV